MKDSIRSYPFIRRYVHTMTTNKTVACSAVGTTNESIENQLNLNFLSLVLWAKFMAAFVPQLHLFYGIWVLVSVWACDLLHICYLLQGLGEGDAISANATQKYMFVWVREILSHQSVIDRSRYRHLISFVCSFVRTMYVVHTRKRWAV